MRKEMYSGTVGSSTIAWDGPMGDKITTVTSDCNGGAVPYHPAKQTQTSQSNTK